MFNWICPECGRDNSPSATECVYCADRKKAEAAAPPVQPEPAGYHPPPSETVPSRPRPVEPKPEPQYQAPYQPPQQPYPPQGYPAQPYAPQPQQHYAGRQQYGAPPSRPPMPTWLLSILFAFAFLGIGAAAYFGYQYFGKGPRAERAGVTEPSAAARTKPANALQKYIEVVGIRLMQDAKKRPQARFIVVNHSNAELNDLTANVTLWASTSRSEEDSVGTFSFKLDSIGPNESKEMTAPLTTKLKVYELPDWQNATADVQLTTP